MLLSLCFSAVMIWTAPPCRAHGVDGTMERTEGYCVTALYDDGEPMSYAAVEIKAPDSDLIFQNARTDRNGRIVFRPDTPGRWQAIVHDGLGHRLALDAEVGKDPAALKKLHACTPPAGVLPDRVGNIVVGLAIIFGLCGLFYGWRARYK